MSQDLTILSVSKSELEEIIRDIISSEIRKSESTTLVNKYEYISRQDTAKLLKISLPTLNTYTKNGIIPTYRIGKNIRFKLHEVEESLLKIKSRKHKANKK